LFIGHNKGGKKKMSNIKLAQQAIAKQEERFNNIAPDMNFQKEMMYAMQSMSNNSYLASCDPKTIASSVLSVAMSGLTLNPVMAHGYLLPRKGKAVFQAGYQGLIYLLISSGMVKKVEARVVHENDLFELSYGTDANIIHKPNISNPGPIAGFYAVATDADGNKYIEHMSNDAVYGIALRSDMNKKTQKMTGAWDTDYEEMGRKTVLRRMFKYLPKGGESQAMSKLSEAMMSIDRTTTDTPIDSVDLDDIDFTVMESNSTDVTDENINVIVENNTKTKPKNK
jgi:recombination protein RecT